jgi:uncharacterized RDD family membrane protein YckC
VKLGTKEGVYVVQEPKPPSVVGSRIVAGIIDLAIFIALFVVFAVAFGDASGDSSDDGASFNVNLNGLPAVALFLIWLTYFTVLEAISGATLGKRAMGLRVTRVDGGPISWGASLGRNLLRVVDGLPFLYLLGVIVIAISGRDQRLGDMAAGTLVVRAAD